MRVQRIDNTAATIVSVRNEEKLYSLDILFSYKTPVAACENGIGFYRTDKKWSVTTSKHINRFLNGAKAEERPQKWFDNLVDSLVINTFPI